MAPQFPPARCTVHRKNVDARTRMRARVSARACEACCNRSAVHSLDEAAPNPRNRSRRRVGPIRDTCTFVGPRQSLQAFAPFLRVARARVLRDCSVVLLDSCRIACTRRLRFMPVEPRARIDGSRCMGAVPSSRVGVFAVGDWVEGTARHNQIRLQCSCRMHTYAVRGGR
jgi:hypothetical protein